MSNLRVIQGDFKRGRAKLETDGLRFRSGYITTEIIPFGAFRKTVLLDQDKQTFFSKLSLTAGGGLIGGIGAGAMAGGLTGPAGAVLGAIAGAVIATNQPSSATCRVELHDGRTFVATGPVEAWSAFEDSIRRAEPLPSKQIVASPSVVVEAEPSKGAKALLSYQKWLPRKKTPT